MTDSVARCSRLTVASLLLLGLSCSQPPPHTLSYSIRVSNHIPESMKVSAVICGWDGPFLDLRGHSPINVMQIAGFHAMTPTGTILPWVLQEDTIRVSGVPIKLATYRIPGPIPSKVLIEYAVSPGKREGDAHIGFTGRCFGYLGSDFAVMTGRDVFLVPEGSESVHEIGVSFSLPQTWKAVTPWSQVTSGWIVKAARGTAAEHLVASTVGLGRIRERSFAVGKTHVVLASLSAHLSEEEEAEQGIRRAVQYLRRAFGRDLGPQYLVLLAPETPEGLDIVGGGWATGQGRTLTPLTPERLRLFADEYAQAYLRYAPYRTEIRRREEFWLVDALSGLYSRRAVVRAGLGDDEAVARGLSTAYLGAVTTQGVSRDLETLDSVGEADRVARQSIGPAVLLEIDRELKAKFASPGLDVLLPRFLSAGTAPRFWSLLPHATSSSWAAFRANYVRGKSFLPVPELFALKPTVDHPNPSCGPSVSRITLAYTGNTDGYLETCGCKANQSGGIARRATILDSIRQTDPEAILLDAGNAFPRPAQYENPDTLSGMEQRFYLEMMDRVSYYAGTVGVGELGAGQKTLHSQTLGLKTPFLCANVFAAGAPLGPPSRIFHIRGLSVLVIGVFEPSRGGKSLLRLDHQLARFTIADPMHAIGVELRKHGHMDINIVMGKLSPLTIRRLVETFPELDIVISTDSAVPLWGQQSTDTHRVILEEDRSGFIGRALVLYSTMGEYGLSVAQLDLDHQGNIARARLVDSWLSDRVPDEDAMRLELNRFYDRVGIATQTQVRTSAPLSSDPYWQGKRFVGATKCEGCHPEEFVQWKSTAHSSAYKTLLDKHRHYQPVCISCHVVGFGSPYGYHIGESEETLGNVQCEMCHGPGGDHSTHPAKTNIRTSVPESVCRECHNPDHSDRFTYAEKLPLIVHRAGGGLVQR